MMSDFAWLLKQFYPHLAKDLVFCYAETKKEQPLKLEYGRCYLNGFGEKIGPLKPNDGKGFQRGYKDSHPFLSPDGKSYQPDGINDIHPSKNDLITLIEDTMEDKIKAAQDKIKAAKANLEAAERELEEAKKPKIRHGDYGHSMTGALRVFLNVGGSITAYDECGAVQIRDCEDYLKRVCPGEWTIKGNIFDDLKASQ